jgi:hypothetical protein
MRAAQADRELRALVNHGRPTIAASPRPGAFRERGVVPAREAGAPYNPGANRNGAEQRGPQGNFPHPGNAVHPGDLPAHERPGAPNTGNQKLDQKYQQQQEKLSTRQNQEHQKLQQKQEQDHQRMARQNANDARRQQVEQHHQQQTRQMEQRHVQQQQHFGAKTATPEPEWPEAALKQQASFTLLDYRHSELRSRRGICFCRQNSGFLAR